MFKIKNEFKIIYLKILNWLGIDNSSFFGYIAGADKLPAPLDEDKEKELIIKLNNNDKLAKNILIEKNLRLVVYISKKFENSGVNIEDLILSQPDSGEQALEISEALIKSGAIDIIVIDSVAALVQEAEITGELGDSHVGLQARLMSQAMRKLSGIISKTKCVAIFINQIREKVGVMYGNPETTPGGRALKFYSTIRLDVRRGEQLKSGSEAVGNKTVIKVVKNKVAPPFKVAEVEIIYGEGISRMGELVDIAVEKDIIHKAGAWFSYNGEKIGQGRENVKNFLKSNPAIYEEIFAKVKA